MKSLYLAIIVGIIISILVTISALVFFEPRQETQINIQDTDCEIYHSDDNTTVTSLKMEGLNDTYKAGCPVTTTFHFVTHGQDCQFPQVQVTDLSTGITVYGPSLLWNYTNAQCSNSTQASFYAGLERNQLITDTQKYAITATLYGKHYQREFTVVPSEYSGQNITAETTLLPGSGPDLSCYPIQGYRTSEVILGTSGFDGVYHRYLANSAPSYVVDDYFLKPGDSGKITIKIRPGSAFPAGENLATGELILDKDSHYGRFDHYGVSTSYEPSTAVAGLDGTATFSLVVSATQDATHGTYWMYLPPGGCGGGKLVLLTIGDRPMAQPPDLIGYDIPVDFTFSESPILTVDVMNFGIHTFDNCSLSYTTNSRTSVIKSFDEIPPGYVYKYHFASNPGNEDKVTFECKVPNMVRSFSPTR
ncbi:MAG: hypothetical protein KGI27_00715 [Thaumarchaeota archaeon]|nr:hypothetical protein [Nitrososphaerota archaeon]